MINTLHYELVPVCLRKVLAAGRVPVAKSLRASTSMAGRSSLAVLANNVSLSSKSLFDKTLELEPATAQQILHRINEMDINTCTDSDVYRLVIDLPWGLAKLLGVPDRQQDMAADMLPAYCMMLRSFLDTKMKNT